jgi:hypothetical protein
MSFWHNRGRPLVANGTSILSHAIAITRIRCFDTREAKILEAS